MASALESREGLGSLWSLPELNLFRPKYPGPSITPIKGGTWGGG